MNMVRCTQTTLKSKVSIKGIGLHSGSQVVCKLHPAPANHGIVFVRSDLSKAPTIRADISKLLRTDMSTTLGTPGVVVATVEHLLAALVGMGVDNVLVELDGPEVPILDGSAKVFVDAIAESGIRDLAVPRKVMRLKKRLSVRVADRWVVAAPAKSFSVRGEISFQHTIIGQQSFKYDIEKDFQTEIASARTFGFLKEVEYLHKKGLALGGSLENVIVLDEKRVLNIEGLRYQNEFVRHKVLDAIGDLALLGMPLEAAIEVHKAGHELHTGFIKKLLDDPTNYEIIELATQETEEDPSGQEELTPALAGAY